MAGGVHARALQRAAEVVGGREELRRILRVSMRELEYWISGAEKPPTDVFLKAVDIISSTTTSEAVERSRELREQAEGLRTKLASTRERAAAIQKAILEGRSLRPREPEPISALAFLEATFEPGDGSAMIEAALDAAIGATDAHMGHVHLACPEGARIVAQRGFEPPFLDFFALVHDRTCACGVALKSRTRIVVADVRQDLLYAGTRAGEVLAEAGVHAEQSTPLLDSADECLGVLSTHYAAPHDLNARDEDVLDHIARRTAFWLEGGAM